MNLFLTATSERGKPATKSGNEYIIIDLNVSRTQVHQLELIYRDDIKDGATMNEWVLQHRKGSSEDDNDWNIIAQGNVIPEMKDKCYKCNRAAKYITHSDKDGKIMPHARFTCEEHHYSI
jgi:hypothetical protein